MKKILLCAAISAAMALTAQATTLAVINPGDTINITGILNTTDPGENNEGGVTEPLIITVDGKTVGVGPTYAVSQTFTYTAPPVVHAPGTSATSVVGYYIGNADGDETATVTYVLNPPPTGKTKQQIDSWVNKSVGFAAAGAVIGTAGAVGCPFTATYAIACNGVVAGLAGLSSATSAYLAKLAADPIDTNFKVIATPNAIAVPTGLSFGKQLGSDESQIIQLAAALITTFNRYQGATAAGDAFWAAQQLATANLYTSQLNSLLGNIPADLSAFLSDLKNIGFNTGVFLTSGNAYNFESTIAARGLGLAGTNILKDFGLTAADISQSSEILVVQDGNLIQGTFSNTLNRVGAQINVDSTVPEPGTLFLIASALFGMFIAKRRII